MPRPSLDEIFGSGSDKRPSLDEIFSAPVPKRQFNTIEEAAAGMKQARQGLQTAERNVNNLDPLVSLGRSAYNLSWPLSAMANNVINKGSPVPEATTGGGVLAQDLSAIANPMVNKAVGAVATGAFKAVGAGAKLASNTFKKGAELIKLNKSLPNANKLQDAINQLNLNKLSLQSAQEVADIQTKAGIGKVSEVMIQDKNMFKKSFDDIVTAFNKNKTDFKKIISDKSGEIAKNIKQPTVTFFRNASKTYGETRDAIFAAIEDPIQAGSLLKKNATPVSRTEFLDEANKVLSEFADQPDIVNSKSYSGLVNLVKKYGAEGADTGIVDASGNAIRRQLPESLDFKQLIGDLKDYNKTFSTGFESGSKALSPDELVAARFNYNMGNIIKERVPKFAELQKSYKPVIDNKKLAYTIFKPGNEVSSTSAQALFKRIANGNGSQQDKDLLKFIQTGTKVGDKNVPGIGNFTKELDDIATKIAKAGKQFDLSKRALTAKNKLDIQTLKEVSKDLVSKNRTNQLSTLGKVEKLDSRLSKLTDILRKRKNIDDIKKGLAVKGVTAAIGGAAGYAVSRLNN